MKDRLANHLLAKVMGWTPADVSRERPVLQALAAWKYDQYEQFSPGMRFVASLATWLSQFDEKDRDVAYEFVRRKLIFISRAEMEHFVEIAFPDYLRDMLVRRVAAASGKPSQRPAEIVASGEYKKLLRQSLFLGLSDGARVDLFRRSNSHHISHEQIYQSYQIPKEKAIDMQKELRADLRSIADGQVSADDAQFRMVFLLDDFSASGLSYVRREEDDYRGKIIRVLEGVFKESQKGGDLRQWGLVDPTNIGFCLVLYVATERAQRHLKTAVDTWLKENGGDTTCDIVVVQLIPEEIAIDDTSNPELVAVLEQYFDPSIVDKHFRKGRHERPYLGFDECGLPLVLSHNTPNNSIPLLWFEERGTGSLQGLFPRVSRHKVE